MVFTLPDKLSVLTMRHPQTVYGLLFASAWETLQTFFNRQGVKGGMISILHTWGQNLSLHPHLHCIVPGGGVDKNGQWKNIRSDGKYLFPVKGLSKMFRAKYVEKLRGEKIALHSFTQTLFETDWVVSQMIDESSIKVQDSDKKGACHQGFIWVRYATLSKSVLSEYYKSRSAKGPIDDLASWIKELTLKGSLPLSA